MKRQTNDTAPSAMIARRIWLNGVRSLPEQRLELRVVVVSLRGGSRLLARGDGRHAPPEHGIRGAEERADGHDGGRHGVQSRLREQGIGLLPDVREPELREGHGGEVEDARPARLVLAVDVVHVLRRVFRRCACGPSASISSRVPKRRQSAGQALTHAGVRMVSRKLLVSAFVRAVPLRETGAGWLVRSAQCVHFSIFGASLSHSAVGTPHGQAEDAVPAADALVGVVRRRAVGLPFERRRRAGRLARGLEAVEAPPHREDPGEVLGRALDLELVGRDERQRLRAQRRRVLEAELPLRARSPRRPSRSTACRPPGRRGSRCTS